jgi:gamma-glutamylcysteine synthetase
MGIGFLGLGFQPTLPLNDIPKMPKVFQSINLKNKM